MKFWQTEKMREEIAHATEAETPMHPAREMLYMVGRYDDLTIPEIVARSSGDSAEIVENLTRLHEMGFIKLDQPEVVAELRTIADDITRRMSDQPSLARRVELLNQTSQPSSISRNTVARPLVKIVDLT
jgi:hypothetical protein